MSPSRHARLVPCSAVCLLALALISAAASAQSAYPVKPIHMVVPYPAGGSTDALARMVGEALGKRLGQPVIVENKAGAGGIIGTDYVAKATPDGYTLLMTIPGPITANTVLYRKLPYDPRKDFRMVSDIAVTRTVLAVHPGIPVHNIKELIAAARANPGKLTMGSWGPGTQPHTIQVYMDKTYGVQTLHVPYKGEGPMVSDLLGGQIGMTVGSVTTLKQHIAAGKLRALAVVGPRRAKGLPEVPTFTELGFPDEVYQLVGPTSLLAPAKTPNEIVERLGREVSAVVKAPEISRRIDELGAEPVGNLPAEADAAYKAYLPVVVKLTRDTGVTLD